MRRLFLFVWLMAVPGWAGTSSQFDPEARTWDLANDIFHAKLELTAEGRLNLALLEAEGVRWESGTEKKNSPIKFATGLMIVDESTNYQLVSERSFQIPRQGIRQVIQLRDTQNILELRLELEVYEGEKVLRQRVYLKNLREAGVVVRAADVLPFRFKAGLAPYTMLRVNQWSIVPKEENFGVKASPLGSDGEPIYVHSGARGVDCAWFALRDGRNQGLIAGWEFDGRSDAYVKYTALESSLQMSATVLDLFQPVGPGEEFASPASFIGVFSGDWDEAGFVTQRFVEKALAAPIPDAEKFPYLIWDSWAYGTELDEQTLKQNASAAARLGFEVFVLDLGWANRIGDWQADPSKFPSGLKTLSDYVHSLGMKFGLHFAFAEAAADSDVLKENPDWRSSETYYYHGAESLCLGHKPVRDWVVSQAIRMIDEYGVDWILQDGENMVKSCKKTTHTHNSLNSNYAGAMGLDDVLTRIRQARPNVLWENCEDGGNMMTFNMVKNYVTSITNDASGAFEAREAVYGATYPFPPRYSDRYMVEEELNEYVTRSHIFGGPWVFMNRIAEMNALHSEFIRREIDLFKSIRTTVRDGKVTHIAQPQENSIDAIASYDQDEGRGVSVVTREGGTSDTYQLKVKNLDRDKTYRVTFRDDPRVLSMTGLQLVTSGVTVNLSKEQTAEVVFFDPL